MSSNAMPRKRPLCARELCKRKLAGRTAADGGQTKQAGGGRERTKKINTSTQRCGEKNSQWPPRELREWRYVKYVCQCMSCKNTTSFMMPVERAAAQPAQRSAGSMSSQTQRMTQLAAIHFPRSQLALSLKCISHQDNCFAILAQFTLGF